MDAIQNLFHCSAGNSWNIRANEFSNISREVERYFLGTISPPPNSKGLEIKGRCFLFPGSRVAQSRD